MTCWTPTFSVEGPPNTISLSGRACQTPQFLVVQATEQHHRRWHGPMNEGCHCQCYDLPNPAILRDLLNTAMVRGTTRRTLPFLAAGSAEARRKDKEKIRIAWPATQRRPLQATEVNWSNNALDFCPLRYSSGLRPRVPPLATVPERLAWHCMAV